MVLRKINAGFSLLSTILLLDHAIFHAAWMLSGCTIPKTATVSRVLLGVMMIHAVISILLAFLGHKGAEKRPCNSYPKLNMATNIQRASGLSLILLSALHILGATGIMQPPQLVHAIVPPLFFTIALAHAAISTGKAFITLGIGSAKFVKILDIGMRVVCVATLIADIVGFYLYVC